MSRTLTLLLLPLALSALAETSGGVMKWGFAHPITANDNTQIATIGTNCVKITENSNWVLAQLADGSLNPWGNNTYGQTNAPDGTYLDSFAGWRHGISIATSSNVVEWGTPYGNAIEDWLATRPASVSNDMIIAVAAGDDHSLALDADGNVHAWGGRSEVTDWHLAISNAVAIDSGWYAGIALLDDGTVQTFGTTSQTGQYIEVPAGLTNASAIGASQWAFFAVQDGIPWGWGMPNDYGQFSFSAEATNIVMISGGIRHTIMARADGTVLTFGDNSQGQVTIPGGLTNSTWISGGRYTSFAIQTGSAGSSSTDIAAIGTLTIGGGL
jgi:alpha-tubulin suppressor-like RCC1 family protein